MKQIEVIVSADDGAEQAHITKGALPKILTQKPLERVFLEREQLQNNILALVETFGEKLLAGNSEKAIYEVEEVELSLSIDAKGGVAIIGSVGGQAGIKIKIKRKVQTA